MFNISIKNIQEKINILTKEDIASFAMKYNVFFSRNELDFIYSFIKNNNQEVLKNPKAFNIDLYKNKFSEENFKKLKNLYNKYSGYLNLIQLND